MTAKSQGFPFLLYSTGAVPKGPTTGGMRSMFAFWMGGANGNGVFVPPVTKKVGGWPGKVREQPRWWEQLELEYAEKEARKRVLELPAKSPERKALTSAIKAVEQVRKVAERTENVTEEVAEVAFDLLSAVQAESLGELLRMAREVDAYARRVRAELEEEEEAVVLLMLH